jgi:hypothetical protein
MRTFVLYASVCISICVFVLQDYPYFFDRKQSFFPTHLLWIHAQTLVLPRMQLVQTYVNVRLQMYVSSFHAQKIGFLRILSFKACATVCFLFSMSFGHAHFLGIHA